ncbi:hypothetical protein [Streptomyces sp. NPDC050548]|uniref:hypothetical protein n=1 Tax=Streptomyces sp. NPDC050548 TaxID=3365629 RepID=UPI00378EBD86
MAEPRSRRRWLALVVFAVVGYVLVRAADTPQAATPRPLTGTPRSATSTDSAGPSASGSPPPRATTSSYDPAAYASQARTRSQQAGVSAQLVMAILYNEAYEPQSYLDRLRADWAKAGKAVAGQGNRTSRVRSWGHGGGRVHRCER